MAKRTKEMSLNLTPWDWLKKAQLLRDASNQLFVRFEKDRLAYEEKLEQSSPFELNHDPPDDSVLMMLFGFAIENLLKGLYVSTLKNAKRPRTLKELGELKKSGHALTDIARKVQAALHCSGQFSEGEMSLLAGLEQTIVWHGRYPSPADVNRPESWFFAPSFPKYPEHHFAASKLYDRLESLLVKRAPFSVVEKLLGKAHVGRMLGDAD